MKKSVGIKKSDFFLFFARSTIIKEGFRLLQGKAGSGAEEVSERGRKLNVNFEHKRKVKSH